MNVLILKFSMKCLPVYYKKCGNNDRMLRRLDKKKRNQFCEELNRNDSVNLNKKTKQL